MNTAKLFTTGRSQAVRLPKAFRMKGTEVKISHDVLEPLDSSGESLMNSLEEFPDHFTSSGREQPKMQKRESL